MAARNRWANPPARLSPVSLLCHVLRRCARLQGPQSVAWDSVRPILPRGRAALANVRCTVDVRNLEIKMQKAALFSALTSGGKLGFNPREQKPKRLLLLDAPASTKQLLSSINRNASDLLRTVILFKQKQVDFTMDGPGHSRPAPEALLPVKAAGLIAVAHACLAILEVFA